MAADKHRYESTKPALKFCESFINNPESAEHLQNFLESLDVEILEAALRWALTDYNKYSGKDYLRVLKRFLSLHNWFSREEIPKEIRSEIRKLEEQIIKFLGSIGAPT